MIIHSPESPESLWLFSSRSSESLWILAFSARSLKLTAALCPSYSRVKQKYRCVACRKIEKKRLEMAKLNILHQVKISNWLNLTFVCNHCHECKSMNAERGDFNLKSELRSPNSAHHVPWKKLARFDWRVLLHCVVYWFRSCFSKRPDYEIYYKWSFIHLIPT